MGRRQDKSKGKAKAAAAPTIQALPECFDCRFNGAGHPCLGGGTELDLALVGATYIAHGRAARADHGDGSDPDADAGRATAWAFECVDEIVRNHPARVLSLLLAGMDACTDGLDVAYFSAGPVEDSVDRHGAALIDRIELMARRSPKFRLFLSGIWGSGRIEPAIWTRIEAVVATGVRLDDDPRTPASREGGKVADHTSLNEVIAERVSQTLGPIAAF